MHRSDLGIGCTAIGLKMTPYEGFVAKKFCNRLHYLIINFTLVEPGRGGGLVARGGERV